MGARHTKKNEALIAIAKNRKCLHFNDKMINSKMPVNNNKFKHGQNTKKSGKSIVWSLNQSLEY